MKDFIPPAITVVSVVSSFASKVGDPPLNSSRTLVTPGTTGSAGAVHWGSWQPESRGGSRQVVIEGSARLKSTEYYKIG